MRTVLLDKSFFERALKYLQHDLDTNIDVYEDSDISILGDLIDTCNLALGNEIEDPLNAEGQ